MIETRFQIGDIVVNTETGVHCLIEDIVKIPKGICYKYSALGFDEDVKYAPVANCDPLKILQKAA